MCSGLQLLEKTEVRYFFYHLRPLKPSVCVGSNQALCGLTVPASIGIDFQILLLVFKIWNGPAPLYLPDHLVWLDQQQINLLLDLPKSELLLINPSVLFTHKWLCLSLFDQFYPTQRCFLGLCRAFSQLVISNCYVNKNEWGRLHCGFGCLFGAAADLIVPVSSE